MAITHPDDLLLWERIRNYQFDEDPTAPITFLDKLCKEQKWSKAYALLAIEEYKKFVFLCLVLPNGASPSHVVDQVWHLHLTYTKSYWQRFCKEVLLKDLHHHPSNGHVEEREGLKSKYFETLVAYHRYFEELPVLGFWPSGHLNQEVRALNRQSFWQLVLLVAVFIGFPWLCQSYFCFLLTGPQFLVYYALLGGLAIYLLGRHSKVSNPQYKGLIENYMTDRPSIFQIAYHFYGKHHAVQAALLNLIDNGFLVVSKKKKKMEVGARSGLETDHYLSTNPFVSSVMKYQVAKEIPYEKVEEKWFDASDFEHVGLYHLSAAPRLRLPSLTVKVLLGLGAARFVQGLYYHRPVGYLLLEMVVLLVAFGLAKVVWEKHKSPLAILKPLYTETIREQSIARAYVFNGRAALASISAGTLFAQVLPRYDQKDEPMSSSCTGGSCSSSSCSSSGGSSCGSSCSSSGCGGCGGGGD